MLAQRFVQLLDEARQLALQGLLHGLYCIIQWSVSATSAEHRCYRADAAGIIVDTGPHSGWASAPFVRLFLFILSFRTCSRTRSIS